MNLIFITPISIYLLGIYQETAELLTNRFSNLSLSILILSKVHLLMTSVLLSSTGCQRCVLACCERQMRRLENLILSLNLIELNSSLFFFFWKCKVFKLRQFCIWSVVSFQLHCMFQPAWTSRFQHNQTLLEHLLATGVVTQRKV